jgi:hypothetical protein
VRNVRIGDRKDHANTRAEFLRQFVLEEDHVGRAVRFLLRIHPMVRRYADDRAEFNEMANLDVDRRVKLERARRRRSELVLNVVRRGQVHEIGDAPPQQSDTCFENVDTGIAAVDRRRGAHERFHVLNSMRVPRRRAGPLR